MNAKKHVIDRLYEWLWLFTVIYLVLAAAGFLFDLYAVYPVVGQIIEAFSDPYLGALGVYVVLKEIRKRKGTPPLHSGEYFVVAWLILLAVSTLLVAFTPYYRFEAAYSSIISSGLASSMIYLGSRLHRP